MFADDAGDVVIDHHHFVHTGARQGDQLATYQRHTTELQQTLGPVPQPAACTSSQHDSTNDQTAVQAPTAFENATHVQPPQQEDLTDAATVAVVAKGSLVRVATAGVAAWLADEKIDAVFASTMLRATSPYRREWDLVRKILARMGHDITRRHWLLHLASVHKAKRNFVRDLPVV